MVYWLRLFVSQILLTLLVATLAAAVYVGIGSLAMSYLDDYRSDIESTLSRLLKQPVTIGYLEGKWKGFSPSIRVQQVSLNSHKGKGPTGISVRLIDIELNVSASIFYRTPVFKHFKIEGVRANAYQIKEKRWGFKNGWFFDLNHFDGLDGSDTRPELIQWLEKQEHISMNDWRIETHYLDGKQQSLVVDNLQLDQPSADQRRIDGYFLKGTNTLTKARIWGQLEGELWPWTKQNADLYVRIQPQSWQRLIPSFMEGQAEITELHAGTDAWLSVRDGDLSSVYANISLHNAAFSFKGRHAQTGAGVISIAGKRTGRDWHLNVRPRFDTPLPFKQIRISSMLFDQQRVLQLSLGHVDVTDVKNTLVHLDILPPVAARYLTHLDPTGAANNVRFTFAPSTNDARPSQWLIQAQAQEVSTQPYKGIPGFTHVSADVALNAQGGVVSFVRENAGFFLDGVYEKPWQLSDGRGHFYWHIYPTHTQLQLSQTQLTINQQDGSITRQHPLAIEFSMRIPHNDEQGQRQVEPNLNVLLGFKNADAAIHKALVPELAGESLKRWLNQGIIGGQVPDAQFVLNGRMMANEPKNSRTIALALEAREGELNYLPQWPNLKKLDATLNLDLPRIDAVIRSGSSLGGALTQPAKVALLSRGRQQSDLVIDANIKGDAAEGIRYLIDTPLAKEIKHALDDWRAAGTHTTKLHLNIPLDGKNAGEKRSTKAALVSHLDDAAVDLTGLDIQLTDLNGDIKFDTENGIVINDMAGQTFGGDVVLSANTLGKGQDATLRLDFNGQATWKALKQRLPLSIFKPITGSSDYNATLLLRSVRAGGSRIDVTSSLTGTHIDYPDMLGKDADMQRPISVSMRLGNEARLRFDYHNILKGVFAFDGGEISRGQMYFGEQEPFLTAEDGIVIRGFIDHDINAEAWQATWQRISAPDIRALDTANIATAQGKQTPSVIREIDLTLRNVHGYGQTSGLLTVKAKQQWGKWSANLDSQIVRGNIQFTSQEKIALNLDYLNLVSQKDDAQPNADSQPDTAPDPMADVSPSHFANISLVLNELYLDTHNLGRWHLETEESPDGVNISVLDGNIKGVALSGNVIWSRQGDEHQTTLRNVRVRGSNIGQIQRELRMESVIESKRLRMAAALDWVGSPMAFNTTTLNGALTLRFDEGHLVTNQQQSGALKLFGALNTGAIGRRLALDFSDLYQPGVSFDALQAKASIKDGILSLKEPMLIDGTGSKFLVAGQTDLTQQTLDMNLVATFPITSSLPLVAIAAGLAPPVAGAIFVTDRLIGDELARFTSARYDVSGTWDEPKLEIKNVFDNSLKKDNAKHWWWPF